MDADASELIRREVIAAAVLHTAGQSGGSLPWQLLSNFPLPDGTRTRLVDPGRGGIWNPRNMAATLSILTSPDGPYADREEDGFLHYSFQAGPEGGKNLKLAAARDLGLPVLRFHKIAKAQYVPIFPVYVVDVNPITREFVLSLDEGLRAIPDSQSLSPLEKRYVARLVDQRVHQPRFRARVMLAYKRQCCVCSLKHASLLDAAHITPDNDTRGLPEVSNGLSLCKIHHAAYDQQFLGIDPDGVVHINKALLEEVDGPMLRHGLQEMHGGSILIPRHREERPDPSRLEERFARFLHSA
ncbi:HNH endonuclease [Janibacter indicus]|uniref:HNH endonuclease n=1 Tax=Janibacter indicus TaxID=857417 RepID=A0A7L9J3J5_9MICO|nr:HNH endonuclease [Janibacter indicus]QOK23869.1 HNH endonuclease [Janibacter indicus]